ncbi:peptide chain release factor N(5)-glutamine methyltransferase [Candidatus Profftella armatura (Diaphorina cf. continua)]|uniref:Release factor glutamine methyltransferase n=1 Tax=Candidatus Profftella armatura (Diaphorina cf. continua) TaxID=2661583 RepID=A0A7R6VZQ4_9PROT|nr:peptide chain release factor N(5)-glutamine methyltransferase [Candidatus Profftella armatura (Diaphorina cf. continua)]BCG49601.1 peptide chain release factor N(5)-glutamine methyltransferase [Candidatus Profftella armatura (Diaphorina cf. continua)]
MLKKNTIFTLQQNSSLNIFETNILLKYVTKLSEVELIINHEKELHKQEINILNKLIQRRVLGEPIAYIIGKKEFYGLVLNITSDVFIPRPETELLVDLIIKKNFEKKIKLLEIGTGSGAIAIAIAVYSKNKIEIIATDINEYSLKIAKKNAQKKLTKYNIPIKFIKSNWYNNLQNYKKLFNIIVSNPPYISKGDIHLNKGDLRFEPIKALTDYSDGLSSIKEIIKNASKYLVNDGLLLIEHGYNQSNLVRKLFFQYGFNNIKSWRDLSGIERVTQGRIS